MSQASELFESRAPLHQLRCASCSWTSVSVAPIVFHYCKSERQVPRLLEYLWGNELGIEEFD